MDTAGCHPEHLQGKFSNIKVCFLPANATSKLQPLDLGIIQNFKVHYRNYFLRHVLAKIDECTCASEVCKSINVLQMGCYGLVTCSRGNGSKVFSQGWCSMSPI